MKIGIMSMQDINNFGSLLQAYALKKILSEYGEVSFLPIRQLEEVLRHGSGHRRGAGDVRARAWPTLVCAPQYHEKERNVLKTERCGTTCTTDGT